MTTTTENTTAQKIIRMVLNSVSWKVTIFPDGSIVCEYARGYGQPYRKTNMIPDALKKLIAQEAA